MRYGILVTFLLCPLVYGAAQWSAALGWALALTVPVIGAVVAWKVEVNRLAGWGKYGYQRGDEWMLRHRSNWGSSHLPSASSGPREGAWRPAGIAQSQRGA